MWCCFRNINSSHGSNKVFGLFFSIIVYCLGAYLLNMKEKINKLKSNFNLLPRIIFGILSGLISQQWE
ncbi:MAG: hypothetical protein CM1200mP13_11390 [Candidatus Pelagibacterales bacterium]|nr:MAG: hypothetical protein CM1200mP13_11390 [Pelagibacterales bacterium]